MSLTCEQFRNITTTQKVSSVPLDTLRLIVAHAKACDECDADLADRCERAEERIFARHGPVIGAMLMELQDRIAHEAADAIKANDRLASN